MIFIFLIGQKMALNQRSGIILKVQIQIFRARWRMRIARQSFPFFKKVLGGLNINIFVKIGMKFPFTFKNKCRNTNLKFEF